MSGVFPDPPQRGVLPVDQARPLLPLLCEDVAGGEEHVGRQGEPRLDHPVRGGGEGREGLLV